MPAAPATPGPARPTEPDPAGASNPSPSPSQRLRHLVRRLIDFGQRLVGTLQQRAAPQFTDIPNPFGTTCLALIIARITRGLRIAAALEARLIRGAARLDAPPRQPAARCMRASPATRPRQPRPTPFQDDFPDPHNLPSAEEIAARLRGRAIGEVIADICTDLGITPGSAGGELWNDILLAIVTHGGNFMRFYCGMATRVFASGIAAAEAATEPASPAASAPQAPRPTPLRTHQPPALHAAMPQPPFARATGPPAMQPSAQAA